MIIKKRQGNHSFVKYLHLKNLVEIPRKRNKHTRPIFLPGKQANLGVPKGFSGGPSLFYPENVRKHLAYQRARQLAFQGTRPPMNNFTRTSFGSTPPGYRKTQESQLWNYTKRATLKVTRVTKGAIIRLAKAGMMAVYHTGMGIPGVILKGMRTTIKVLYDMMPFKTLGIPAAAYFLGSNAMILARYFAKFADKMGWDKIANNVMYMTMRLSEIFGNCMSYGRQEGMKYFQQAAQTLLVDIPLAIKEAIVEGVVGQYFGEWGLAMYRQGKASFPETFKPEGIESPAEQKSFWDNIMATNLVPPGMPEAPNYMMIEAPKDFQIPMGGTQAEIDRLKHAIDSEMHPSIQENKLYNVMTSPMAAFMITGLLAGNLGSSPAVRIGGKAMMALSMAAPVKAEHVGGYAKKQGLEHDTRALTTKIRPYEQLFGENAPERALEPAERGQLASMLEKLKESHGIMIESEPMEEIPPQEEPIGNVRLALDNEKAVKITNQRRNLQTVAESRSSFDGTKKFPPVKASPEFENYKKQLKQAALTGNNKKFNLMIDLGHKEYAKSEAGHLQYAHAFEKANIRFKHLEDSPFL